MNDKYIIDAKFIDEIQSYILSSRSNEPIGKALSILQRLSNLPIYNNNLAEPSNSNKENPPPNLKP